MNGTLYIEADNFPLSVAGEWWKEQWVEPRSVAFVCMHCGDVWARAVFPDRYYEPAMTICAACPSDGTHCPGSILWWFPWNRDLNFIASLPLEVWRREVEIHCRHAERELG